MLTKLNLAYCIDRRYKCIIPIANAIKTIKQNYLRLLSIHLINLCRYSANKYANLNESGPSAFKIKIILEEFHNFLLSIFHRAFSVCNGLVHERYIFNIFCDSLFLSYKNRN